MNHHSEIIFKRTVYVRLREQISLERSRDSLAVVIKKLRDARFDASCRRLLFVRIIFVSGDEQVHSASVRADDSVLAPLFARNLFEDGIDRHRDVVHGVVSSDESSSAALFIA